MSKMIMRMASFSGVTVLLAGAPSALAGVVSGASITYGPQLGEAAGATAVPTIGGLGLLMLAVLMAVVVLRLLKTRPGSGSAWLVAGTLVAALAAGGGGIKLVSDAQALPCCSMGSDDGGTVFIPGPGYWEISNNSTVPQYILDMQAGDGCFFGPSDGNGGSVGNCNDDPSTLVGVSQYCAVFVTCPCEGPGNGASNGACAEP